MNDGTRKCLYKFVRNVKSSSFAMEVAEMLGRKNAFASSVLKKCGKGKKKVLKPRKEKKNIQMIAREKKFTFKVFRTINLDITFS